MATVVFDAGIPGDDYFHPISVTVSAEFILDYLNAFLGGPDTVIRNFKVIR